MCVCMFVCVCVLCIYVYVCTCVFLCVNVCTRMRVCVGMYVSLSKELYSHCSSPPSCINEWVNRDLAIAGEPNAKLCMSHLMVVVLVEIWMPMLSSIRHVQSSCRALAHPQEDFPA